MAHGTGTIGCLRDSIARIAIIELRSSQARAKRGWVMGDIDSQLPSFPSGPIAARTTVAYFVASTSPHPHAPPRT